MSTYTFVMIEDDSATAELQKALLERKGHNVHVCLDARDGVEFVLKVKPDILVIDIMMPDIDGLEICRRLRTLSELKDLKIIVVSSKSYPTDRARALSMGADGMLLKPVTPTTFVDDVLALASQTMTLTYWGVRGTMPVPGRKTLRYGGNTACLTLELPREQFFIFDAGSGIRELSRHVMSTRDGGLAAKLFFSNPHGDHISALPLFVPLYISGNEFEIIGPSQGAQTMRELVGAQMDGTYAPMTLRDIGARVSFRNLSEEEVSFGDITVRTILLTHPGNVLGYRVTVGARSICYVTDNELHPRGSTGFNASFFEKLKTFAAGADILAMDATYSDAEYRNRVNWGHSPVTPVAELAHAAGVKQLHLIHHDPEQTDDDIDRKLGDARGVLAGLGSQVVCMAPAEGSKVLLASSGAITNVDAPEC